MTVMARPIRCKECLRTCGADRVPQEDCVVRGAGGRTTGNGLDDDCDGQVDEGCQCDERTGSLAGQADYRC